ncbi:hypothetical protein [Prosthecobacter sp.]|uniref:hypothetical protein n=1 Tax=Prosthecobacter sp. TaxID=1965333 RepID=UPI00378460CE
MNPAQLRRSFVCCSVSLAVTMIASCSSMMSPAPPPPPPPAPVHSGITGNDYDSGSYRSNELASTRVQDRPGLGTSAGQEKYSVLENTRLIRKSSVPDAVDSFHYNDEKGAKTMAEVLGGSLTKRSGLFSAAGERLKVGLMHYRDVFPHYEVSGKRIVIGQNGSHYDIRLENRTKKRMLVVLSVDGLNVLTGQAANPSQSGFVLEPRQSYDVDGFRKNSTTARAFVFGSVARSKAATKGAAGNVGVIGLAVFEEDEARVKAELLKEQQARGGANAFPEVR